MIKKATFGGGCFWCTEALFQEIEGVTRVESGYSGGNIRNPSYMDICTGKTNHAEVIQISYDSELINLEDIVTIHMTTHDPTTLNRQGADKGTQYRSIIFFRDDSEKAIIEKVIMDLNEYYDHQIITEIKAFDSFYLAEMEHQNYYKSNTNQPYCQAIINPKLSKFRQLYADRLKKE